jgi:site-specific DNA recombinase
MTQRVAIYARYSSDLQSASSIEDQVRLCELRCTKENWPVTQCYTDAGISGASLMRPGIQMLMTDAMEGKFDVVLAEALDRLSRDQEDIAGLYKRLEFAGVRIVTLSEGEIFSLHIGLKGTMNAMFLKDLADKTRRGLRGRVELGKSGGGISYGYRALRQVAARGERVRGDREIDPGQTAVIVRIFDEYAHQIRLIFTAIWPESWRSPSMVQPRRPSHAQQTGKAKPARRCGCQRQPQPRPVCNQVGSGGRI